MSELVKNGRRSPAIRQKAVELTQLVAAKDGIGEIGAIFDFVQNQIRYVRDIENLETIHFPEIVLENASGDCDDKSVLLAALLSAIGYPTRFVAVGPAPETYSHVYVEVKRGRDWSNPIALDATEDKPFGWRPWTAAKPIIFFN